MTQFSLSELRNNYNNTLIQFREYVKERRDKQRSLRLRFSFVYSMSDWIPNMNLHRQLSITSFEGAALVMCCFCHEPQIRRECWVFLPQLNREYLFLTVKTFQFFIRDLKSCTLITAQSARSQLPRVSACNCMGITITEYSVKVHSRLKLM